MRGVLLPKLDAQYSKLQQNQLIENMLEVLSSNPILLLKKKKKKKVNQKRQRGHEKTLSQNQI
jgi:hypothetical protein